MTPETKSRLSSDLLKSIVRSRNQLKRAVGTDLEEGIRNRIIIEESRYKRLKAGVNDIQEVFSRKRFGR